MKLLQEKYYHCKKLNVIIVKKYTIYLTIVLLIISCSCNNCGDYYLSTEDKALIPYSEGDSILVTYLNDNSGINNSEEVYEVSYRLESTEEYFKLINYCDNLHEGLNVYIERVCENEFDTSSNNLNAISLYMSGESDGFNLTINCDFFVTETNPISSINGIFENKPFIVDNNKIQYFETKELFGNIYKNVYLMAGNLHGELANPDSLYYNEENGLIKLILPTCTYKFDYLNRL
jgi:hypothetical protein